MRPHFPAPDLSGEARLGRKWGHIEAPGIVRIKWVDIGTDQFDLSRCLGGGGVNFTSNLKCTKTTSSNLRSFMERAYRTT